MRNFLKSLRLGPSGRRFFGLLRPVRVRVSFILIFSAISVGLGALGPLVLGKATDSIFDGVLGEQLPGNLSKDQVVSGLRKSGQDEFASVVAGSEVVPGLGINFGLLGQFLLIAAGLYALSFLIQLLIMGQLNRAIHTVMERLRRDCEQKIHRIPISTADARPRGDLLSRVTNDIDNVTVSLTQSIGQMVTSVLTLLSVLGFMLYLSPLLTLATVVTLPLAAWGTKLLMKRSQPLFIAQWQQLGALNTTVDESITGHEIASAFDRTESHIEQFRQHNDDLTRNAFRAQGVSGFAMPLMTFVGNLSYVSICVVGGLRVASGSMTIGEVQAFIQYGRQFSQPVTELSGMLNELQSGIASAERVFEFLDLEEEEVGTPSAAQTVGRVEFDAVGFSYNPQSADTPVNRVVDGLTLVAEPGETVAIVGPTGAGKTTLVNLLLRFYDVDEGHIRLDGQDITEMSRTDVRSRIGMVLQDTWLFEGTIRDNIAYGAPDASNEDIERAAMLSYVDQFADALPEGLDTWLEPDGGNLSIGERQLITIARAFLTEPPVLILDEATSSVDSRTAMLIQKAIRALRSGRTSFVIAHRLATVRDADRIAVIDDGQVVEVGSHEELMESHGLYREMQTGAAVPA